MIFWVCEWPKFFKTLGLQETTWDFDTLEDAVEYLEKNDYCPMGESWDSRGMTANLIVMGGNARD